MTETRRHAADSVKEKKESKSSNILANKRRLALIIGIVVVLIIAIVATAFALNKGPATFSGASVKLDIPAAEEPPEIPKGPTFPLTGLPADDESLVFRRPLSIKLENTPEARPQQGITQADVVYETVTEGGITRFNCIFQSRIPDAVGSVRSGRNSDVTIAPQYDALFFMSGANKYVNADIASAGLLNMSANTAGSIYYRVDFREAPHNMFLDLTYVYDLAEEMGFTATVETPRTLEFGPSDTANATDATHITVPFSDYYIADWQWDANAKVYYRSMDEPSYDMNDDTPITATNLVVLWVDYVPFDFKGTFNIDMNSGGAASIFYDGKRLDGTWKTDGTTPPRFEDADGNPIKLTPGNTWFQVVNTGDGVTVS